MKLNIQLYGGRGASSSGDKELAYYKKLKRYQQQRLKNTPKDAEITRDAIKNAIKFADDKIKELSKQSKSSPSYEAMMKYVGTGKSSDFKDYVQLDNGNIIARAKNGTYSVISGSKFIVDGERIPTNGKYMQFNSSMEKDMLKISAKKFIKIKK